MQSVMMTIAAMLAVGGMAFQFGAARAADPEKFMLGAAEVWAIADNTGDRDMGVFIADAELLKQYAPTGASPSAVMCFLVKHDGTTVLLDTGNGNPPGPRASLLMDGLAKIGVKPESVDAVVITHMHGDHIGGLAWEGKKAFPNATVKIGRVEHDFWLDDASLQHFPDRKANFDKAKEMMAMYAGRVEVFDFGAEIVPGMTALDSRGHTPGHTAVLIEYDGQKLLCIGDLLHSAALQFARPDINARYDMNPEAARMSRIEFFNKAASENLPVAGMHLPFPGIGRIASDGPTAFKYTPGM